MQTLNVAIIDSNPERQQQLEHWLQQQTAFSLNNTRADVLLLDLHRAGSVLNNAPPPTPVLLLINDADAEQDAILDMLAQGCRGFINPTHEMDLLARALQTVANNEAWVTRKILGAIMENRLHWPPLESHNSTK